MNLRIAIERLLRPAEIAYAHCDVPCGIYDPSDAETDAETVEKMMTLIADLAKPAGDAPASDWATYNNSLSRYIATKEKHAESVKHEVRIIWGDFFKTPDLAAAPNVHEHVWMIMQTASKCRVGTAVADAQALRAQTAEFTQMFNAAKAARG